MWRSLPLTARIWPELQPHTDMSLPPGGAQVSRAWPLSWSIILTHPVVTWIT